MKQVQWYPGHMAKAVRMLEDNLSLVDAVLFVLDARAPASSYNPRLETLVRGKPVLYVLNKSDLADSGADEIAEYLKRQNRACIKISAIKGQARQLIPALNVLTSAKTELLKAKGQTRPLRVLVAGIPNTGKSSVINLLSGGKKAITGDKAGVTRSKQWVKCDGFDLLDSPGLMPPSLENQTFARRLAALGCVNDDILEMDEIALFLLEELWNKYPAALTERYAVKGGEPLTMLEALCKKRGFLVKGGECDYERGERALIDDFRKGKLSALTLDSVADAESVWG